MKKALLLTMQNCIAFLIIHKIYIAAILMFSWDDHISLTLRLLFSIVVLLSVLQDNILVNTKV